jgi:hypothetical protein
VRVSTGIGIILVVFLWGCTADSSLKKIDPYIFIHDNSSKVWLVDKLLSEKRDYTPMRFQYKQIIVFHESRNAYFYRLNEFGDKPGIKSYYWMDKEKDEFGFQIGKKEWIFDIRRLSRTKIILRPKYKSYPYTIVLIPFPEY